MAAPPSAARRRLPAAAAGAAALLASLLLLLLPAAAPAAEAPRGADGVCEGGAATCPHAVPPAGDEDASLLQRNLARHQFNASDETAQTAAVDAAIADEERAAMSWGTAGDRRKAVVFEGGGYLAHADFAGAFMGLLNQLSLMGKPGGLSTLMKKFGIVGGISGGAWYCLMMIYSSSFSRMLYLGATVPELANIFYNTMFIGPMLNPFKKTDGGVIPGLGKCLWKLRSLLNQHVKAELSHHPSAEPQVPGALPPLLPYVFQLAAMFITLIQNGQFTWRDVVTLMFEAGAGIGPDLPLGTSKHNKWAKGKVALSITSAITPAAPNLFGNDNFKVEEVALYNTKTDRFTYGAEVGLGKSISTNTNPSKFTAVVGNGLEQHSPYPFCSSSDCNKYMPSYNFNGESLVGNVKFSDFWKTGFEESAGHLHVSSVASASSAFLGALTLQNEVSAMQGCSALEVWTTGAKSGKSFDQAAEMRREWFSSGICKRTATAAAGAGLQPLVDGALEDNPGIADALTAGATEVLSFQDVDVMEGTANPVFVELFQPKSAGKRRFARRVGVPSAKTVFEEPTAEEVEDIYQNKFTRIEANPGSKFLKAIAFGTIDAVTKANPTFSIESGRMVKLNVVAVETLDITIGMVQSNYSFNSFFDYGELVGEISRTMSGTRNMYKVRTMLNNFFL